MNVLANAIFMILAVAFVLLNPALISEWLTVMAQNADSIQNTEPSTDNNTIGIINMVNHTITWMDKTTNKTISIQNFEIGNATNNENVSLYQSLAKLQNTTHNGTIIPNLQNTTSNVNMTTKFNDLKGK